MLNSRIFSFFSLFIYIPLALYTHRPSLQSAGIYQAREERREEETKNNICECDEKWKRGENVMETIGLGRRWRHYRFKKILLYYYYYYLPVFDGMTVDVSSLPFSTIQSTPQRIASCRQPPPPPPPWVSQRERSISQSSDVGGGVYYGEKKKSKRQQQGLLFFFLSTPPVQSIAACAAVAFGNSSFFSSTTILV